MPINDYSQIQANGLPKNSFFLCTATGDFVSYPRNVQKYMPKMVNQCEIEVHLNIIQGTLKFVVNGTDQGDVVQSEMFKQGEWLPTFGMWKEDQKVTIINPTQQQFKQPNQIE